MLSHTHHNDCLRKNREPQKHRRRQHTSSFCFKTPHQPKIITRGWFLYYDLLLWMSWPGRELFMNKTKNKKLVGGGRLEDDGGNSKNNISSFERAVWWSTQYARELQWSLCCGAMEFNVRAALETWILYEKWSQIEGFVFCFSLFSIKRAADSMVVILSFRAKFCK